ncbi:kinase-like domain-containing protein [Boletus coccyginus]|nr:kinase-like domain-containing protein [Boletus coccyginus]
MSGCCALMDKTLLSSAMNISLRQVEIDPSQTMFVTSTGTLLFTSYTTHDQRGCRLKSVITSVDDHGSTVEVGLIKWNQNAGGSPSLCMGAGLMELRTIERDDSFSTIFRGSDRRIYRWQMTNEAIVLAVDGASSAPIAIAYDDAQSFLTVDVIGASVVLCIQPTGFHLVHEVVATFILVGQLFRKTRVEYDLKTRVASSPYQGPRTFCGEPRIQLTKDSHWTYMQHVAPARLHDHQDSAGHNVPFPRAPSRCLTRSTADLTGELLRRYKYPSAYGGFGDIWKCDWLKDSRVIEVAVKVMRTNPTGGQTETESKRISRELKVWVRLEHECVLPLYGISYDFGKFPAMVCPWLEGGTLSKYLEHHEGLQLHTRLQLLSDIASGLQYLHGCGIVHGDLTGSNVLIKDNGKACLSDFGLSRIFMETTGSSYLTSTVRGSVRWAAPELFEIDEEQQEEPVHVLPNPQSDIYSFGSTMLQVLTGKVPYHYYKNDAQVLVALSRGLRPTRPYEPHIDDLHWEFTQRCWSSQSKRPSRNVRPSIEEVVDFLSVARTRCG